MKKGYTDTLSNKKIIKDQSLLRHEDIRHQIQIIPELKELIPPLLPDELAQLENNIRRDGCREALLVWETSGQTLGKSDDSPVYILVDGHNRYGICQRNGIDFRVNLKEFSGMEEVRTFMIENQLGRRNLTPEQTSYLRGLRYRDEKGTRGAYDRNSQKGQNVPNVPGNLAQGPQIAATDTKNVGRTSTAEKLAKQFSVNEKTIKRDAAFAAGVEKLAPTLKADILAGRVAGSKALFQELGKRDIADGSITTLDELATMIESPTPATDTATAPAKRTKKSNSAKTTASLRAKLKSLVDRIATGAGGDAFLCDEIIACAGQLRTALLENLSGEGKEKPSGGRPQQGG